jgi:hypothetical protein
MAHCDDEAGRIPRAPDRPILRSSPTRHLRRPEARERRVAERDEPDIRARDSDQSWLRRRASQNVRGPRCCLLGALPEALRRDPLTLDGIVGRMTSGICHRHYVVRRGNPTKCANMRRPSPWRHAQPTSYTDFGPIPPTRVSCYAVVRRNGGATRSTGRDRPWLPHNGRSHLREHPCVPLARRPSYTPVLT